MKTVTINRVDIVDKALEGLKKQVDAMKVLSSCVALVTRTVRPRNLNEETRTLNLVFVMWKETRELSEYAGLYTHRQTARSASTSTWKHRITTSWCRREEFVCEGASNITFLGRRCFASRHSFPADIWSTETRDQSET